MPSRTAVALAFAAGLALVASAQAAPDKTLGPALMSAVVDPNGTLVSGTGVKEVVHTGTGGYYVYFERSVEGCTPVASPLVNYYDNFVAVNHTPTPAANSFRVLTGAIGGSGADTRFSIIVFCGE